MKWVDFFLSSEFVKYGRCMKMNVTLWGAFLNTVPQKEPVIGTQLPLVDGSNFLSVYNELAISGFEPAIPWISVQ